MDAKAKVVPYSPRIIQTFKEALVAFRADPDGKWISRTDHEAALAELTTECADHKHAAEYATAELQAVSQRLTTLLTLLTGLEALAVHMAELIEEKDARDEGFNAACTIYAAKLRTLASAGLEGKDG